MSAVLDVAVEPLAVTRLRADLSAGAVVQGWPRGAIGARSCDGAVRYGYPEIAGYWLHWACRRQDVDARTGAAVVDWLRRVGDTHGGWPPRVSPTALDPAYQHASYLFDHAMLWHGLQQWGQARHLTTALALAQRVWLQAQQFLHGGDLVAARGAHSGRWSGHVGPFLLKACARLRYGAGELAEAASRALPSLIRAALENPHPQAHPQLYAIEGLIELGERAAAARALQRLIDAHGGIVEVREAVAAGPRRSDVLAQLLRAALWLDRVDRDDPQWLALADELADRVDNHGRLPFAAAGDDCPTWAALFAEQALTLWCRQSNAAGTRARTIADRGPRPPLANAACADARSVPDSGLV